MTGELEYGSGCVAHVPGPDPKVSGAPGEIRTPDPLLRRQTLYPTELRARRLQLLQSTALTLPVAIGNCGTPSLDCTFEMRKLGWAHPALLHVFTKTRVRLSASVYQAVPAQAEIFGATDLSIFSSMRCLNAGD
jgi:hypothetical protein